MASQGANIHPLLCNYYAQQIRRKGQPPLKLEFKPSDTLAAVVGANIRAKPKRCHSVLKNEDTFAHSCIARPLNPHLRKFAAVATETGIAAEDVVLLATFPKQRFAIDAKDQTLADAGALSLLLPVHPYCQV